MARLFFNIWPFVTMKICLISKKCHSRFEILPNTKLTLQKIAKDFKVLPKWCNFIKSGNTAACLSISTPWDLKKGEKDLA